MKKAKFLTLLLIPFISFSQVIISDSDADLFNDRELLQNKLMQEYNEVVSYDWNKLFPNWNASQAAADTTVLWPR